jgi:hypothetical protein
MTDWSDVALVLRGWLDDGRRLRVRVRSERVDGTFLCKLRKVDADECEISFFADEGNPSFVLDFILEGCFFEFKDVPERVRQSAPDEHLESAVFVTGWVDLAIVVLED